MDVYPENFISDIQDGTKDTGQMLWHLFSQIDKVFRPNNATDTDSKELISLKKVGQGGGACSTQKKVIG